jgi:tRNA nucleotidyltransferase (CCA-adding enzyme)
VAKALTPVPPEQAGAAPGAGPLRLSRNGLPGPLLELCERLAQAGYRAWVVGGSVRDSLLAQLLGEDTQQGWRAKDWDLATDATPEQVIPLFRRVIPTGIEHGTVSVLLGGFTFELTTLRADRSYSDGRRPEHIDFVQSIDEDLARRDFTVNAIAFEPRTETLIDPYDGVADLRARKLRAVGEPAQRFAEDGLRVLRAARLLATLEFELEEQTARAIAPSLDTYRRVSAERIREEWNKAFLARAPSRAFEVMHEHGLLGITAPELERLAAVAAIGSAPEPARSHAAMASADAERAHPPPAHALSLAFARMDSCPREIELRLAALARDADANPSRAAELVDALLTRLRYSNLERKRVTHLVRNPLPALAELDTGPHLRRWLRRIGPDQQAQACALERAHRLARGAGDAELTALDRFEQRAAEELQKNPPLALSALAIDGKQLMSRAGFRPGRLIGTTLEALLEHVLDDPTQNEPNHLLEHARRLRAEHEGNPGPGR